MNEHRPAWIEVDLGAVRRNVATMAATVAPAELLAVVKADAYGHGAVEVAGAALDAGAVALGVALVEEGHRLRATGVEAPILVLAQPARDDVEGAVAAGLEVVVYSPEGIEALAKAVAERGAPAMRVHLKVDTGMHRVGCRPDRALDLAARISGHDELVLAGVMTHFAVADEPDHPFTRVQADRFDDVVARLRAAGYRPEVVHAANSAAGIVHPRTRHDLVRTGIAVYGIPPAPALAGAVGLAPVLSVHARVGHVQRVPAGESVSYGLRYAPSADSTVVTVPVGYGDGVPRRLGAVGAEVLVGGRRRPIAGTITMDQLMVDVGDSDVDVGDEVVLLGSQGDEVITATEWAQRLGTIAYEVVCGFGARLPRRYR